MSTQTKSSISSSLANLPINELETNPFQPRDVIRTEDIQELAQSIRTYGVIEPLVVAQTPAGYQIIAGERRWRAAKIAGLTEVPVSIIKTTPKGMLELALVENVQRQDLNAIERAKGFHQLVRDFSLTVNEISQRIGKSSSYVSNSLRLLSLPDLIKDSVINGMISEGHARALVSLEDESSQIQCYKKIVEEKSSVRGAEDIVRKKREREKDLPAYLRAPPPEHKQKVLIQIESLLKKQCQTPVKVELRRSSTQTKLSITFRGNERTTEKDLGSILKKFQG